MTYAVIKFSDGIAVSTPIFDLATKESDSQKRLHQSFTEEFPLEDDVCPSE